MALVIGWFYRSAVDEGKNGAMWATIGGVSFFAPFALVWVVMQPIISANPNLRDMSAMGLAISTCLGIIGCWLAARKLKQDWPWVTKQSTHGNVYKKAAADFQIGDKVIHPTFGAGTVEEIKTSNNEVLIYFEKDGKRALLTPGYPLAMVNSS